jgi:CheY-like chemotaxis protein
MTHKPLILIAEDDRGIRDLLQAALEENYRLLVAEDGLQTIEQVKNGSPDLILMDIWMPKLSGWQVIREIRAKKNMVPIIVITGIPDPYNNLKAQRLGVVACLPKPFDVAHLRQLIREKIEHAPLPHFGSF